MSKVVDLVKEIQKLNIEISTIQEKKEKLKVSLNEDNRVLLDMVKSINNYNSNTTTLENAKSSAFYDFLLDIFNQSFKDFKIDKMNEKIDNLTAKMKIIQLEINKLLEILKTKEEQLKVLKIEVVNMNKELALSRKEFKIRKVIEELKFPDKNITHILVEIDFVVKNNSTAIIVYNNFLFVYTVEKLANGHEDKMIRRIIEPDIHKPLYVYLEDDKVIPGQQPIKVFKTIKKGSQNYNMLRMAIETYMSRQVEIPF